MDSAQRLGAAGPTPFGARFGAALGELNHAQKSGAGVPAYTRWVNRRLARRVAAIATAAGLSANAVTLLSALLSGVGLILLVLLPPTFGSGVVVAVALAAGYVLDSADGQVARLTGQAGPAGEWLDHVVDSIRTPALHVGIAVAAYVHLGDDLLLMGTALCFAVLSAGQFMSQILAGQLAEDGGTPVATSSETGKSLLLLPTDTGTFCWFFVCWGLPAVFAPGYLALFLITAIHSAVSMRRKYARLRAMTPAHSREPAAPAAFGGTAT